MLISFSNITLPATILLLEIPVQYCLNPFELNQLNNELSLSIVPTSNSMLFFCIKLTISTGNGLVSHERCFLCSTTGSRIMDIGTIVVSSVDTRNDQIEIQGKQMAAYSINDTICRISGTREIPITMFLDNYVSMECHRLTGSASGNRRSTDPNFMPLLLKALLQGQYSRSIKSIIICKEDLHGLSIQTGTH